MLVPRGTVGKPDLHFKPSKRAGFTLIELILVIGVIMILVGLALPVMSKSIGRAKDTRSLAAARQCAIYFQWYTDANKEFFPRGEWHDRFGLSTISWPKAMKAAGLADDPSSIDPDGSKRFTVTNFQQSLTTMVDWRVFEPGMTRPLMELQPTWIRTTDVLFPDKKGMLSQILVGDGRIETTWCCVEGAPKGVVAWCDQSVSEEYWLDLLTPSMPMDEYGTGAPVHATWKGVKGRDRW